MSTDQLIAILVTEDSRNRVLPGGTPVFIASSTEEQQNLARLFSRMFNAMAHDLENGLLIIVRH